MSKKVVVNARVKNPNRLYMSKAQATEDDRQFIEKEEKVAAFRKQLDEAEKSTQALPEEPKTVGVGEAEVSPAPAPEKPVSKKKSKSVFVK